MPRVVPSQVLAFIDLVFPWAQTQTENYGINLTRDNTAELAGLLALVDQIPEELLTLNGTDYSSFICGVAAIRERLALWVARGEQANELVFVRRLPQFSPVTLIRRALSNCPDESPAPATTELNFIPDADLRTNLRNDIGAINRALSKGEWKAATVLAGSTIEALLLWALQRDTAAATAAAKTLTTSGTLRRQPAADLESWALHEYIEVAVDLGMITPETATQTRLAKDFRNLIHPGRAQRLGQKCDRATALSAVAGMEHVIRNLP